METQQLKQLAGRVRALLEEASIIVGHSQALDLSAALVGLRNWPEVQAFPQLVSSQNLDLSATTRLAYRLDRKYGHQVSASDLLQQLLPPAEMASAMTPQIWPSGPRPGVYLTTSTAAIDVLVAQYQEATDGAVFFTERAGADHPAAIDLGEYGLWSTGLQRVPSGTLLVLGPVELDQQSWTAASERVEMACLHAANSGHRVAILVDSPTPEQLGADAVLMVTERDEGDLHEQVIGTVLADGTLQSGIQRTYRPISTDRPTASSRSLPSHVTDQLRAVMRDRRTGILAMGSLSESENPGADVAEAGLSLTDHLGPAVWIMPRHRGTMSKFRQVPSSLLQLPFLPSIESAYAQGYRRFLVDARYTKAETIARYVHDSLLIAYTYAGTVEELALCTMFDRGRDASLLPALIAAVAVSPVAHSDQIHQLTDLYVGGAAAQVDDSEEVYDFVMRHRTLRVEDQLAQLIKSGVVDLETIRSVADGHRVLKRLLRLIGST